MSKTQQTKKANLGGGKFDTGRLELKMQRHTQRAHKFVDRRKQADKQACRNKGAWS